MLLTTYEIGSDEDEEEESKDMSYWKDRATKLEHHVNSLQQQLNKKVSSKMRTSELVYDNHKISQKIDKKLLIQKVHTLSM